MKSREISRSKIGPFSLACTDPYIGIGWEYQSILMAEVSLKSKKISNDQELIQSDPISCPQNQKGNN